MTDVQRQDDAEDLWLDGELSDEELDRVTGILGKGFTGGTCLTAVYSKGGVPT